MKTLLHCCCAPCANQCIDALRGEGLEVTGFWYNPNIHPVTEYRARRNTLEAYARQVGIPLVMVNEYALRPFVRAVAGDIAGRCVHCYEMRLFRAAEYAAAHGFDSFTSSLFISPYQQHELMREVAGRAAEAYGVTFLYTPSDRKTGSDSFTYTATDASGNVSAPATVHITISKQKTGVRYSDMSGHSAQTAAICLAEEGICVGRQVGNTWFFDPEETVSRSEFLAMAMTAAGLEAEDTAAVTTFSDDAAISAWARGYAAAASQAGILSGVSTDQGAAFRGEDPISFNEAATVLDRLMNVTDVQIPEGQTTWAAQAMANMESVQVVSAGSFGAGSLTVTRADAAQMLSAALPFLQEEDEGWFSSLF